MKKFTSLKKVKELKDEQLANVKGGQALAHCYGVLEDWDDILEKMR